MIREYYRDKRAPENVTLVTSGVSDRPFDTETVDAALSTMIRHEFVSAMTSYDLAPDDALAETHRVLEHTGRRVLDWIRRTLPATRQRYTVAETTAAIRAIAFRLEYEDGRSKPFFLTGALE
ncbi:class I SAM-dependent methyltransferase [Natrinema ejinorense]|uniref:Uncharacterized protein n=1 Tax=Natrinema ejinorense TaxID=373386 RepID=A0A2A5QPP1_9EURY|nr:methyltransferase domain-containing protein [Natrinema ejinorense]PCR88807.1 hypothetical protein CP557_20210 [Natrinema ejinorense]